jgi:DUF1365 family protein
MISQAETEPGAIYEGTIRHRRYAPRPHELCHRLALLYVDLDRIDELLGGTLDSPKPGLIRYRRSDYLGDPSTPLSDSVRKLVHQRTGLASSGPVWLLANLRTFGHCFNPVSFYFCFDQRQRLEAVVTEVTNTPWKERHAYVLRHQGTGPVLDGELTKQLHVSPFMGMRQRYALRVAAPGPTLSIHIESSEQSRVVFDATLSMRRAPLTRARLRGLCARYPAATLRVLALIYAHAAVLKLKGLPVHARPLRAR